MPTDPSQWIMVASTVISTVIALAVLTFGLIQYKQVARKDFVDDLSKRVDQCEANHAACEKERTRLERLNFDLLQDTRTLANKLIEAQRQLGHDPETA